LQARQPAIPIRPSGRLERAAGPDTTLQEMGFKGVNIQTYGAAPTVALPPAVNGSTGVPPGPPPRPMPSGHAATPPSAAKQRPPSHQTQRPSSASQHRRVLFLAARLRYAKTPTPKMCSAILDVMLSSCRPSSAKKPDRHKGMAPIIIVPKGYDTKINMFNAQVGAGCQSMNTVFSMRTSGSCLPAYASLCLAVRWCGRQKTGDNT
jgi:hypothetical protein